MEKVAGNSWPSESPGGFGHLTPSKDRSQGNPRALSSGIMYLPSRAVVPKVLGTCRQWQDPHTHWDIGRKYADFYFHLVFPCFNFFPTCLCFITKYIVISITFVQLGNKHVFLPGVGVICAWSLLCKMLSRASHGPRPHLHLPTCSIITNPTLGWAIPFPHPLPFSGLFPPSLV
jgi:hypothetical protein